MTNLTPYHAAGAFFAAMLAGAINTVAGGGTLVTFPTLVWLGLPPVTANATSNVSIVPGSVAGMWGFRRELSRTKPRMLALIAPSLIGGLIGALLLQRTPPGAFAKLVPFLIAFATTLFMLQEKIRKTFPSISLTGAMIFQFGVALYGGYFGAGIGILMLAALSVLGMTDILEMNGLKNSFALCINGIAALYFIWAKMVLWPYVAVMAVGAVIGGYGCAGIARRVGGVVVRRAVIVIGWAMAISLFIKN